ncbi:MAG: hypothetical protein R2764_01390 [Bacteroidales bacterium]
MKIKVEYKIPSIMVSETIEVGNVKNGQLNQRQSRMVDTLVRTILSKKLEVKAKEALKPKVIVKMI